MEFESLDYTPALPRLSKLYTGYTSNVYAGPWRIPSGISIAWNPYIWISSHMDSQSMSIYAQYYAVVAAVLYMRLYSTYASYGFFGIQ